MSGRAALVAAVALLVIAGAAVVSVPPPSMDDRANERQQDAHRQSPDEWLTQAAADARKEAREAAAKASCNPRNSVGYVSKERCETCVDQEDCIGAIATVQKAQRAAVRGDLSAAIESMEQAVRTINRYRIGRIQRWDNLAELYCLRALDEKDQRRAATLRSDGLGLLKEFRCGLDILQGRAACALPNWRNEKPQEPTPWGLVTNPSLTPLCYSAFCSRGFQNDDFDYLSNDPDIGDRNVWASQNDETEQIEDDAANLPEIEQLCRRGLKQ